MAKSAGFCFGVSKALSAVEDLLGKNEKIYTYGPIIHNEQMIRHLKERGVFALNSIDEAKAAEIKDAVIVVRAHGIPPDIDSQLKCMNYKIVDKTCPFVRKIHMLVKDKYLTGFKILILGDENHPEIVGINGECNNEAVIIKSHKEFDKVTGSFCEDDLICVVAQTTFNVDEYDNISRLIKERYKNAEIHNTICSATYERQKEAVEISRKVDMMIVIGGRHSSNSNRLYELCKENCPETYLIETSGELPPVNINKIKKIGITAGASTPEWIIEEVLKKMDELNKENLNNEEIQEDNAEINFEEALEGSVVTITSGSIVKGTIFKVTEDDVMVDLSCKYEGTLPLNEISDDPYYNVEENLKPGQEIEVLVLRVIDSEAVVILSKKRVDVIRGWDILEDAYNNKTSLKARVLEVVKGGVIAVAHGIKVFVPASQVSDRFVKDLSIFLKQILTIRIVDFNRNKKKVVGSQRVIIEEEREVLSKNVWESIEVGKVYNGKVKSFTSFGAFVDIGGVDGLIHITEISWNKIRHPSEALKINQEVEVFVLDFNKEKQRISLGYKKAEDDPWKSVAQDYYVGDVVKGKVVRMVPFGAFVQIDNKIDALVHISQISNKRIAKPEEVLKTGMEVEAKIVEMDVENRKIGLSIKEVNPIDPVSTEEVKEEESANKVEAEATEHKEEMSTKIGDVFKDLKLD